MPRLFNPFMCCRFLLILFLLADFTKAGETLFVYYPTAAKNRKLEKLLKNALSPWEIKVFGRYKDFIISTRDDGPDLVLAHSDLQPELKGYREFYRGFLGQSDKESYCFLSINDSVKLGDLHELCIGVVDIMGRKKTEQSFIKLFKTTPRFKHVGHLADMQPLLTFGMVDAVFVSKSQAEFLINRSKIKYILAPLPDKKLLRISLFGYKSINIKLTESFLRKIPDEAMALFNIDTWKIRVK